MPNMQITTRIGCTIACDYCPQETFIEAYKSRSNNLLMRLDDFQSYIQRLPSEVNIWFAGMCEPWLNPECTEMMLHSHIKGHHISVFTTVIGMRLSDIDAIEHIPFGFFRIHVPTDLEFEKRRADRNYLAVLDKICKSTINATFHCHGKHPAQEVLSILKANEKTSEFSPLYQRSGNIKISNRLSLAKKRGVIGCRRNSRCNVLLPNGDVLLCSNDYGMKHILGNIVSSGYDSLFNGNEFEKVRRGLQDESMDVLCRTCDNFSYDKNLSAKIYNLPYSVDKYLYYLRDLRNPNDLKIIVRKSMNALKRRVKLSFSIGIS